MGCFPFHQGDKEKFEPKRRKFFWWSFAFGGGQKPAFSRGSKSSDSNYEETFSVKLNDLRIFSYAELKTATRNFPEAEKLGEGGFGAVYKGQIKSKKPGKGEERIEVAVKQLNVKGQQGQKEWMREVTYLGMVDHSNLVKLLGYCMADDERGPQFLLVYEFLPNRSLDDHIFSRNTPVLPWKRRLQIAIGTAKGLAYLHEEMKPQIIFRDLKAANILLDNDFNPKLSDFGLARLGPTMGDTHVTTNVVGTAGYAAPEYIQTGYLTAKSDVWSFGMVLLELLTGRRALDMNRPRTERSLSDWVKPYMNDSRKFQKIMDSRLQMQYSESEAKKVLALAQRCISKQMKARPKMSDVVRLLEEISETVPIADGSPAVTRKNSMATQSGRSETSVEEMRSRSGSTTLTVESQTGESQSNLTSYFTCVQGMKSQEVEGSSYSASSGLEPQTHLNGGQTAKSGGNGSQESQGGLSGDPLPLSPAVTSGTTWEAAVPESLDGSIGKEERKFNMAGAISTRQSSRKRATATTEEPVTQAREGESSVATGNDSGTFPSSSTSHSSGSAALISGNSATLDLISQGDKSGILEAQADNSGNNSTLETLARPSDDGSALEACSNK